MVFVAVGALAGAVLASRRYRAFLLVPVAASMAWGQASCIQSIHMPELRCVLSSGQS